MGPGASDFDFWQAAERPPDHVILSEAKSLP
jgi:hypothetical protein